MSKLIKVKDSDKMLFDCPGCEGSHYYDAGWTWNGSFDKPTFRPSMRIRGGENGSEFVCHFFVTDGKIEFCGDSTHNLAGQSVELPEIE